MSKSRTIIFDRQLSQPNLKLEAGEVQMGSGSNRAHKVRSLWRMDNLEALSRLPSGSVGLAYLDPPFNSGRSYDALVTAGRQVGKDHRGEAFTDHWAWSAATEDALRRLPQLLPRPIANVVSGLVRSLGTSDLAAYLVMMASRLGAVHRSLAETGSLYVHCDPGASHYLKVVLDYLFGPENFRNEIIWKRTHAHSSSRRYGPVHDTILFYSRSPHFTWNPVYADYQASYIQNYFTHEDERGRYQLITCTAPGDRTGTRAHYEWKGKLPPPGRHWAWQKEQMGAFELEGKLVYSATGVPRFKHYVEDGAGVPLQDLWTDINRLDAHSDERIGYETQKPLALLERIVAASSKPDDIVLDAFCGTGTTMVAAERLGRQWIGIDSSLLGCAISLARLRQEVHAKEIELHGFPSDSSVALQLLKAHPVAFGFWGTSMLGTLADRKTFSRSLATGIGRLQLDQHGLQVLSWVPLQHNIDKVIPHLRRSRLRRVAFILRVGRPSTGLREWVQQRLDVPVHEIPLDNLVEAESLKRGLASEVVRLAGAA